MKILYVTSEAVPFCKTGGLADVAGSLPPALAEQAESNCDREQLTAALYAMGAIPLETLLAEIPG